MVGGGGSTTVPGKWMSSPEQLRDPNASAPGWQPDLWESLAWAFSERTDSDSPLCLWLEQAPSCTRLFYKDKGDVSTGREVRAFWLVWSDT